MMKFILALVLVLAVSVSAQAPALNEMQTQAIGDSHSGEALEDAKKLCATYCKGEFPAESDAEAVKCEEACLLGLSGDSNGCTENRDDPKDMKIAFWSGCSFGWSVEQNLSCGNMCGLLKKKHNLSWYSELACSGVCTQFVKKATEKKHLLSCAKVACAWLPSETCWRGCNIAMGIAHGATIGSGDDLNDLFGKLGGR